MRKGVLPLARCLAHYIAPGALHKSLLSWYDQNRRELPWREHASPYRTWISEIMLQQTQVETALPYFLRFMRRFPNLDALAEAKEEEVLKYWAGLGYYSRAKNLLAAAHTIVADYQGHLPQDAETLKKLPGIGPYTAAAIASIAFDRPNALVDGNVARVLSRLFALPGNIKATATMKRIWEKARACLDFSRPGDWNQALMELGARVCLPAPESPRCEECPLKTNCKARRIGAQHLFPKNGPKPQPIRLNWTALYIEQGGKILLWRRDLKERFLRGHWGLPEARQLKKVLLGPPLRALRHNITHHKITLTVRQARLQGPLPPQARWVPKNRLKNYLVSSLWRKAIP